LSESIGLRKYEARCGIFDGAVKNGGRGRVFDAIMETMRFENG
jgi:hypothetical protein